MARRTPAQKSLAKIKENQGLPMTYGTIDDCVVDYLKRVETLIDGTDWIDMRCNKSIWIENNIFTPMLYLREKKSKKFAIDENDMEKTLEVVLKITNMLAPYTRYTPTLVSYCRVLCVSTSTFDNWTLENSDKGEKAREIQDYFKGILLQGLTTGEYNPVAGSFIGKTTLGMKENDGSKTSINVIATEMSLDQIMKEYEKNRS